MRPNGPKKWIFWSNALFYARRLAHGIVHCQVMMVEFMSLVGSYTGVALQASLTGSHCTICLCEWTLIALNNHCKSNGWFKKSFPTLLPS